MTRNRTLTRDDPPFAVSLSAALCEEIDTRHRSRKCEEIDTRHRSRNEVSDFKSHATNVSISPHDFLSHVTHRCIFWLDFGSHHVSHVQRAVWCVCGVYVVTCQDRCLVYIYRSTAVLSISTALHLPCLCLFACQERCLVYVVFTWLSKKRESINECADDLESHEQVYLLDVSFHREYL